MPQEAISVGMLEIVVDTGACKHRTYKAPSSSTYLHPLVLCRSLRVDVPVLLTIYIRLLQSHNLSL